MTDESDEARQADRPMFRPRPGETAAEFAARVRLATSSMADREREERPTRLRPEGSLNPVDGLVLTTNPDGSVVLEGNDGRDYEWFYSFTAETWSHLAELVGSDDVLAGLRALFERDRSVFSLMVWLKANDIDYDFASFGTMSFD